MGLTPVTCLDSNAGTKVRRYLVVSQCVLRNLAVLPDPETVILIGSEPGNRALWCES